CATGRQGLAHSLSAAEILNQIVSLPERERLTKLVFMGMGEPLDNTDNVLRALEILTSEWGFGWSPTRITLSTAGVVPELRRFLDATKVHLAVSLHNPFSEERAAIMPVERAWPVAQVAAILREYDFTHQRRVSFEYIVLSGTNDTPRHVKELCRLLDGIKCRINLIRFHKIPGSPYFSPGDEQMIRFRDALTARGIQTTIRASRGEDIQAACGLLSTEEQLKVSPRGSHPADGMRAK
ncbi:MAG: radical SAM protein, partial [Alistipes sp.]|nr:radical SAM protein [Alistipes sp.]